MNFFERHSRPDRLGDFGTYRSIPLPPSLVRLDYDPAVLESPSVLAGPMLSESHVIDFFAPESGRLKVVVFPDSGLPAFTAPSGTLFTLSFDIPPSAPNGITLITFTTLGTPDLPTSDLTDTDGNVAAHDTEPGHILVGETAVDKTWMLYD